MGPPWRGGMGTPFSLKDDDMLEGVLTSLPGEMASGEGCGLSPDPRDCSKKFPGCSEEGLLVAWDKVEELLDVLRLSWCCPVLNCTSNGDDG